MANKDDGRPRCKWCGRLIPARIIKAAARVKREAKYCAKRSHKQMHRRRERAKLVATVEARATEARPWSVVDEILAELRD